MDLTSNFDFYLVYITILLTLFYGCFKTFTFYKIRKYSKTNSSLKQQFKTPSPIIYLICILLLVFTIILALLALKQTKSNEVEVSETKQSLDIVFIIDVSLSMNSVDVIPTRLARVQDILIRMAPDLAGNRVGIIVFAGNAFSFCPMTTDITAFSDYVNSLGVDIIGKKGTDISSAFDKTNKILSTTKIFRNRIVVFVSDGEDHESSIPSKLDADLIVWGIGTEEGGPIFFGEENSKAAGYVSQSGKLESNINSPDLIISKINESNLKAFANSSGGEYFNLTYNTKAAYDLLDKIEAMKKNQTLILQKIQRENGADIFLITALVCFFIERFLRFFYFPKKEILILIFFLSFTSSKELYAWDLDPGGKRIKEGIELYQDKKFSESGSKFKLAEEYFSDDTRLNFDQGTTHYQSKNYDEAIKENEKVIADNKASDELKAKAFFNNGNTYYRQNNFKMAQKNYEEALNLMPNHLPSKKNIEMLRQLKKQGSQNQENDSQQKTPSESQNEKSKNNKSSDSRKEDNKNSKENADRMMDHFSPESILKKKSKGGGSPDNDKFW